MGAFPEEVAADYGEVELCRVGGADVFGVEFGAVACFFFFRVESESKERREATTMLE